MVDRHSIGDLVLAVLLVLPLAWVAKPQTMLNSPVAQVAPVSGSVDRSLDERISLLR